MMAIDGTWQRPCTMQDVSETGARLSVGGSIEGLPLKEFLLVLSTVGKAYRRCQLAWVNGDQVGVRFIKASDIKKEVAADRALNSGTASSRPGFVDGPHHRLKMARFEQKDRSSVQFERQAAPCEIFRLVQPRGVGQASTMIFHVHAYVDDHMFEATAKTARDAFAKAIEWHVVGRLTGISISDGNRSYSIAEFASLMALTEIANTVEAATGHTLTRPA